MATRSLGNRAADEGGGSARSARPAAGQQQGTHASRMGSHADARRNNLLDGGLVPHGARGWFGSARDGAQTTLRVRPARTRRRTDVMTTVMMDGVDTPSATMRVPYGQTVHGEEEIAAVVEVLRTSTQMGARVRAFEARVAELFAKRHGVMVNSGSSALQLATELLGLREGDEVVTPVLTFATTVAPLVRQRLVPSFVDVEPDTFNIDVDQIAAAITPRTRAVVIPSLIGNLPDWDRIAEIARSHGL